METIHVQLSEGTLARIDRLSAKTGKTHDAFLVEALEERLSDLEALEVAEERLLAHRSGTGDSVSQSTMEALYGVEH